MNVAVVIAFVALTILGSGALVVHGNELKRAALEREHLIHLIVARHVGEVRALERDPEGVREERPYPHIEGLS